MGKLIKSLLISIVVLFAAIKIGWIVLGSELPVLADNTLWNQFIWLGIIAVIFSAVSYVASYVYSIFLVVTLFLGCVTYPLYILLLGYLKLAAVDYLLPGFSYTGVWWQVLILSILVGLTIPSEKKDASNE